MDYKGYKIEKAKVQEKPFFDHYGSIKFLNLIFNFGNCTQCQPAYRVRSVEKEIELTNKLTEFFEETTLENVVGKEVLLCKTSSDISFWINPKSFEVFSVFAVLIHDSDLASEMIEKHDEIASLHINNYEKILLGMVKDFLTEIKKTNDLNEHEVGLDKYMKNLILNVKLQHNVVLQEEQEKSVKKL